MLVKIFGITDLITASLFWIFAFYQIIPTGLVLMLGLFLLVKGAVFLISGDVASILDVICSGFILAAVYISLPAFISVIVTLFLIQKGIFSLL